MPAGAPEWLNRVVNGKFRLSAGSPEAYLATTAFVVLASVLRWGLGFLWHEPFPFPTYYPAVFFATLIGGAGAGTFATIFGGIIGWWAFMPPQLESVNLTSARETSGLVYLVACAFIVWGAERHRVLTQRLKDEENLRKLAAEELRHRLKNKMATIQSIINYQLRGQPQLRNTIISRLVALSNTDDLMMTGEGVGARIGDIISNELVPYDTSRISIKGPDLFLCAEFSLTMALMVHELATNAAKYGALSNSSGKVSIAWSLLDQSLKLEWHESGGPIVRPPTHRGFGLRLLSGALAEFRGTVETTFDPSGLICKMTARTGARHAAKGRLYGRPRRPEFLHGSRQG
jgi:two-component sensor histidine kinase